MDSIIWFKGMACKPVVSGWKVRMWRSPVTKQAECLIYPRRLMVPLDSDGDQTPCPWIADEGVDVDLELLESRAARNARDSAARARRSCRQKIKHSGMTQLLTLTYRENMEDLKRMRRDMAAWLRIMRRLIPGFRAVYGFEQQGRGAWHCHIATDKLPMLLQYKGCKVQSWRVGTAVWRSVVPGGGLCFVGGRGGRFNRYNSAGKIAGYISKYLTKDNAAGQAGKRMWDGTQNLTPPAAVTFDLPEMDFGDAISLAFELRPGEDVLRHQIVSEGRLWMLYTEPVGEVYGK